MTAHAETLPARVTFRRPSLGRLAGVELRKMVDTRAGFWLLLVIGLLIAALVAINLIWGDAADQDLAPLFRNGVEVASVLLPVLGILVVTSEWSQRTGLATFSLVPERERVIAAKALAAAALTALVVLTCLVAAAVGTAISGGSWDLGLGDLARGGLYELIGMLGGIAFGLAFLSSALAIVLYFVLPTAWAILGETISALEGPAEWLDTSRTLAPLMEDSMAGGDWARLAVSVAVWVGAVLAVGLVRLHTSELK